MLIQQAIAACQTAMVKLKILEKALEDTTIRAPFDGWVAEKLVSVGEQISSGMQATKVVTLVRIDPLRLSLTVPQQSVGFIQPGQTVRFEVDSFPNRKFEAKVRYIAPVVTNDTRSMLVEALASNPDGELFPGMFATADLESKKQKPGVYVPVRTVQKMGEVARVFVVLDGIAHEQVVALGEEEDGKIEIRSGLTGKEVLVAQPERVHDGDKVR
jgi:membrane fusion protein, multidrug efflux system